MPRPNNKRKAGEIDFEDPMSFVLDYCRRHGLPEETGNSSAEKECAQRAADAREEYKTKRDAAAVLISAKPLSDSGDHCPAKYDNGDSPLPVVEEKNDRKGLSPAQKYSIRLQNNRKSAYASKVYNEILKRELSFQLRKLEFSKPCITCRERKEDDRKVKKHLDSIKHLERQLQSLREDLDKEKRCHLELRSQNDELNARVAKLTEKRQRRDIEGDRDQENATRFKSKCQLPCKSPCPSPTKTHRPGARGDSDQVRSQPSEICVKSSLAQSQIQPNGNTIFPQETPPASIKFESQPHQENIAPSQTPSFHQRLMTSKVLLSFSPPINDSENEEFHTGLTCTQSQNEDTDEKTQLLRNLPTSNGIPVGLLSSQPSQSEIGAVFKSSLGSEDLQMGEPELFLSSQGTNGSLTKPGRTT